MTPSAAQFRAARAWLGWSRDKASGRSGLAESTIRRIEKGKGEVALESLELLRSAYSIEGIAFLGRDGIGRAATPRTGAFP